MSDQPKPPPLQQMYGIVLVKELKNPNNQKLSRKDTAMAFSTIFKLMARGSETTNF